MIFNMRGRATVLLMMLLLTVSFVSSSHGQDLLRDKYKTVYAITGVTIVTGSGSTIENGTIVLQDGIITAMGTDIAIPADAVRVEGENYWVYPGFIDMQTNLGFKKPAERRRGMGGPPAPPADEEKKEKKRILNPNFRADQLAFNNMDMMDPAIKEAREAGFTAAVTIPRTGVFPGSASLVATHGEDPMDVVIKPHAYQYIMNEQSRGGYPNTSMGVVAFQRQMLMDAFYNYELAKKTAKNPRGSLNATKNLLRVSPEMHRLFTIATGEEMVVIQINIENKIKMAFDVAQTNKTPLNLMLSGVTEGYRVVELLKEKGAPLIVSLNYPKATETTGYAFNLPVMPFEKPKKDAKKEEDEPKHDAEKKVLDELHGNALILHNAGLTFSLSAGGEYGKFLENLRFAVKAGLSSEVALNKITAEPASMLNVSDIMGTVEVGKLANLVVTNGDLFADETVIKMTFVEGDRYIKTATPKKENKIN